MQLNTKWSSINSSKTLVEDESFSKNQLGRRNLISYQRCSLLLSMEDVIEDIQVKAKERQGVRTDLGKNIPLKSAEGRDEIAALAQVGHDTSGKVRFIN